MKTYFRTAIVLGLSLVVLFLTAANVTSAIEIRGPVYDGSDIDDIIDIYGDGTTLKVDATQLADFYYDIDDEVTTETLSIKPVKSTENQ